MANTLRVALAGGGTGGHLYPALAIAEQLAEQLPAVEFLFFGTSGKIEARVVPQRGYPFASIWISGFHRSFRPENLLFPVKVIVSLWQSWTVLRRFRPHVVVGTGGYVCGPVLFAASAMGIPTVIHESNSYPGVTTRMLASRVDRVLIAFDDSKRWLRRTDHVTLVGTPVRRGLGTAQRDASCKKFGLDPLRRVVMILGGSLGAASINRAVAHHAAAFRGAELQLLWQIGRTEEAAYVKEFGNAGVGHVTGFIDDMDAAYAASDLVVCRAGASTLAELTAIGKASVLVPYPHAAADHQTKNARTLESAGAAEMVADKDVMDHLAANVLRIAQDPEACRRMAAAARTLGRPDAAGEIAHIIRTMVQP
ncbi:MAG: undecaprenyldiphospho-muramoylpentapeptide beta-N-acetylglucosaminyltransferase [Bacteroidota bacterium]